MELAAIIIIYLFIFQRRVPTGKNKKFQTRKKNNLRVHLINKWTKSIEERSKTKHKFGTLSPLCLPIYLSRGDGMTQPVDWNGKGPSGDPSHPPPGELGMGPINNQLTVLGEFGTLSPNPFYGLI